MNLFCLAQGLPAWLSPGVIWFLIGLALLLVELALPGLIVMFFGLGAWITAILCLATAASLNVQLLVFIATSLASLLLMRKWLKGIFTGHVKATQDTHQDLSDFIGAQARVTRAIGIHAPGQVELHGTDWAASSDRDIPEGTLVRVIDRDSLTLKVTPV